MTQFGDRVFFESYDDEGEPIVVEGVVEAEFTEPLEEDAMQRLNYRVRTRDGRVFTPYAHECKTWARASNERNTP